MRMFRSRTGVAAGVAAGVLMIGLAGCGSSSSGTSTGTDTNSSESGQPAPADKPAPVAIPADTTVEIPGDVKPGTYTAKDASSGCYWARLKGTSGELEDIAANENAVGPTLVTILKGDKAFESNDCGDWVAGTPKIVSDTSVIDDGTWAVGVNVKPGKYKTSGVSGCYWARLKNFSGDLNSIIANDNVDGGAIVTIKASDKGFTTRDCGTWKRSG